MGQNRIIKVAIPTKEDIKKLEALGIDVEAKLVEGFMKELHTILHPEDENKGGLLN